MSAEKESRGEQEAELRAERESVWDYPRPPRVEPEPKRIRVVFNDIVLADTVRAQRVLETSHPPVYYIPPQDVQTQYLTPTTRSASCEWKGRARYFSVQVGDRQAANAAWCYPNPSPDYEAIQAHFAFFCQKVDACYVGEEQATPQPGDFYGGWITSNLVGPFKGAPGTWAW